MKVYFRNKKLNPKVIREVQEEIKNHTDESNICIIRNVGKGGKKVIKAYL